MDLDAKEANLVEVRTIAEVLELYLAINAHPRNEGGLAPSTYERYEQAIGLRLLGKARLRLQGGTRRAPRYAVTVASVPAMRFNQPQAPRAWREDMLIAGVPKPTRDKAWSVLSAALSWAATSQWLGVYLSDVLRSPPCRSLSPNNSISRFTLWLTATAARSSRDSPVALHR